MKRAVVFAATGGLLLACSAPERIAPTVYPSVRHTPTRAEREVVPNELLNAGCAVGQAVDDRSARVTAIPQSRLPFSQRLTRMPLSRRGHSTFIVQRYEKVAPSGSKLTVACLVPLNGDEGRSMNEAIAATTYKSWSDAAGKSEMKSVTENVTRAVGTLLRQVTFPRMHKVDPGVKGGKSATKNLGTGMLPPMIVTAGYNWSAIDWPEYQHMMETLDPDDVLRYELYKDEGWAEACETYNQEFWKYYETKDEITAAIQEIQDYATALRSKMIEARQEFYNQTGISSTTACPTTGPKICIMAWIQSCWVGNLQGDCHGIDKNATASEVRLVFEVDPVTKTFTYKYSGTNVITPCLSEGLCKEFVKDSAKYAPAEDMYLNDLGNGSFELVVNAKTSACAYWWVPFSNHTCPAINMKVGFQPNSSRCGYNTSFNGDKAPSWGVWCRDSGELVLMRSTAEPDDPIAFFMSLNGFLGQLKENLGGPPEAPPGCYVY